MDSRMEIKVNASSIESANKLFGELTALISQKLHEFGGGQISTDHYQTGGTATIVGPITDPPRA